MVKYIAILRGINVGGKRIIRMADLRQLFIDIGYSNIQTYIQSGNVVFNCDSNCKNLSKSITAAISEKYGFEVPVIIRTVDEWKSIVLNNPILKSQETEHEHLYVTFLSQNPKASDMALAQKYDDSPNYFRIIENNVYGYCSGKYHETKYTNTFFEKKLKVSATTRNWKTVLKIIEMLG